MYRTGKSYLLNRVILDKDTGFGVAPTVNACTKGIWIWSKPLTGQTEEGTITNILVIDSEGLGAVD
jgi:Guanylate-binding protein, N-terminal domain